LIYNDYNKKIKIHYKYDEDFIILDGILFNNNDKNIIFKKEENNNVDQENMDANVNCNEKIELNYDNHNNTNNRKEKKENNKKQYKKLYKENDRSPILNKEKERCSSISKIKNYYLS